MREIGFLIGKEIKLELRKRYMINGILLYVISTIFVCYQSFHEIIDISTWNALFWIIMLFTSVNAISKSFIDEGEGKLFYLYTLASPQAIIISKIAYNVLLMMVVSLITIFFYALFIGSEALNGANLSLYISALILGGSGLSAIFTMISAIASKTNNNIGIAAILGFPIVIPLLVTLINVTGVALNGLSWDFGIGSIVILVGINLLVVALSYLLFPYLWRD